MIDIRTILNTIMRERDIGNDVATPYISSTKKQVFINLMFKVCSTIFSIYPYHSPRALCYRAKIQTGYSPYSSDTYESFSCF